MYSLNLMYVTNVLLVITAFVSLIVDFKYRKIPNYITITSIFLGLAMFTIFDGLAGLKFSLSGLLFSLLLFSLPYLFGGMGGGDVKLMAAIGALKGWRFVLLTTIYSGLIGGIIIIIILVKQKKLLITLKRVLSIILKPLMFVLTLTFENKKLRQFNNWLLDSQINWEKQYIPYGVAIGIGAIMALLI